MKLLIAILVTLLSLSLALTLPPNAPKGYHIRRLFPANPVCARPARDGDVVHLQYSARISPDSPTGERNKVFDSTGELSLDTILSDRKLLTGLYHGIVGMCEGERRVLTIPSEWAYGSGFKDVPEGAVVQFTVSLVGVFSHIDLFHDIDSNGDNCLSYPEIHRWVTNEGRARPNQINAVATRMFNHDNKDGDDFITCEEFSGATDCDYHQPPTCLPSWEAFEEIVDELEFN